MLATYGQEEEVAVPEFKMQFTVTVEAKTAEDAMEKGAYTVADWPDSYMDWIEEVEDA